MDNWFPQIIFFTRDALSREIELQLVANLFLPSFQGAREAECLLSLFIASQTRKAKDFSICFKNNTSSELPNNPRESLVVFFLSVITLYLKRENAFKMQQILLLNYQ